MSIKTVCTWGEGEDITVVFENEKYGMLLYENPVHLDRAKHGYCENGSFMLTKEQARKLAAQLNEAADRADELEYQLKEYFEKHKE